jgi:hypothetical protein
MDQTGGKNKTKKSTKTTKTTKTKKSSTAIKEKKPATKKTTKKTKTHSKKKGGNFLGTVGDLVAPTGWGPFATAAGLLALDRADAALRRGTKEKKEKMKGGLKDNEECRVESHVSIRQVSPIKFNFYNLFKKGNINFNNFNRNFHRNDVNFRYEENMLIWFIKTSDNLIILKIQGDFSRGIIYNPSEFSHCMTNLKFNTLEEAIEYAKNEKNQKNLGKILVKEYARTRDPPIELPNKFFELSV